jgi:hypothetical protein
VIEWRLILDGPYEVSSAGQVRRGARVLRGALSSVGYRHVTLSIDGRRCTISVHRLVAEAFVHRPDGCDVVNHLDGDKLNNAVANLEWTTPAGNSDHARSSGLLATGERHGRSTMPERTARGERVNTCRITEGDVVLMRRLRSEGWSLADLAARFGLGKTGIHAVCSRQNWRHVA